ncbi:MAG: ribosome biogenesis factor YjgA [Pseudomonadales bacterium]
MNEEKPSKSSRKREAVALQALGEELTRQSRANLERLPLDPVLREAVEAYRTLTKRLAQRRQLRFIGRLMRDADADAVTAALAALKGGSLAQKQRNRWVEQWQARLTEEGDAALTELVEAFPEVNRQALRSLVRHFVKEPENERARRALRRFLVAVEDKGSG